MPSTCLVLPTSSRPRGPPVALLWICTTGLARTHPRMSRVLQPCTSPSWTQHSGAALCSTERCRDTNPRPSRAISAMASCEWLKVTCTEVARGGSLFSSVSQSHLYLKNVRNADRRRGRLKFTAKNSRFEGIIWSIESEAVAFCCTGHLSRCLQ